MSRGAPTWASSNGEDSSHTAMLRTNLALACQTSKQDYKFIMSAAIDVPARMSNEQRRRFSVPSLFSLVAPGYRAATGEAAIHHEHGSSGGNNNGLIARGESAGLYLLLKLLTVVATVLLFAKGRTRRGGGADHAVARRGVAGYREDICTSCSCVAHPSKAGKRARLSPAPGLIARARCASVSLTYPELFTEEPHR